MSEFRRGFHVRAMSAPWYRGFEFLVMDYEHKDVGVDIVMREYKEAAIQAPTFRMDQEAAQDLLNDLWHAGLRPSDGTGSTGQLAATENHLKDMQEIVKKLLDKILTEGGFWPASEQKKLTP